MVSIDRFGLPHRLTKEAMGDTWYNKTWSLSHWRIRILHGDRRKK